MTTIPKAQFTPETGLFELSLINAENISSNFDDVVIEGINRGIPPEILTRLRAIWDFTRQVAGEIIAIGKIIVSEIFNFLKANPKLTIGLALGAAITVLIYSIPLLGPVLAPLAGSLTTVYAAGTAAAMEKGDAAGTPLEAAIALAEKCFELLINIFNAIKQHWTRDV